MPPPDAGKLEVNLSGGASNTDPAASLGGARSSVVGGVVSSQTVASPAFAGVDSFDDAWGNPVGVAGTLRFKVATTSITWQANGDTEGALVDVSSDGQYTIRSGNGRAAVLISVTSASLPGGDDADTHVINADKLKLFDDISASDALGGDTEHRCVYIHNADGVDTFQGVSVYIQDQPPGADDIRIGLDPAGINGTATTIALEDDVPTGVTFSTPGAGTPLDIGSLAPGDFQALWIERDIPVSSLGSVDPDEFELGLFYLTD